MEMRKSSSFLRRLFTLKNFLFLFILMLFLLAFAVLMDYVVMPFYTKHGKEYELPDVTDRPIEEAMEILDADGFKPLIQDSVYDETISPGYVIQQNPLPFSLVKDGRRVYLVVSIGEKPIFIPQLVGLTPQDAQFRLREQSLRLNQTFYEFSDFYPRGVVINQSIPAGKQVRKNRRVNITVSLGTAPTSLVIPNLVGQSLETAEKELEAINVRIGTIKYAYRPKLVPGTILRQSVSAGANAARVEELHLLVSSDVPPPEEAAEDTVIPQMEAPNVN
jgi:beta-lactam-binding protein with PASTA domain